MDQSLVDYLVANKSGAEYLVAVEGAQSAESIIVATGEAVMAMGGFSGSDPWPTLAQFQELVAAGKIRYVLTGGSESGRGPNGPAASSSTASPNRAPDAARNGPVGGVPAGIGGGPGSTFAGIEQWITQHGTVVDASEYGGASQGSTLYQLW